MATDVAMTVVYQQSQAPVPTVQMVPQAQAIGQPTTQQAPETTSPDVVVEEIVEIILNDDDDDEQAQAVDDEESTIFSMIQA